MIPKAKLWIIIIATFLQISRKDAAITSSKAYTDFKFKLAERALARAFSQYARDLPEKVGEDVDFEENWLESQPQAIRTLDLNEKPNNNFTARSNQSFTTANHTAILSKELLSLLLQRQAEAVKFSKLKSTSKNSTANVTTQSIPLRLTNLVVDKKYKCSIEFNNNQEYPSIRTMIQNVTVKFNNFLSLSNTNVISLGNKLSISSDAGVLINNNVNAQNLYVNNLKVKYLNDQNFEMNKVLVPGVNQNFSLPLDAKNIYIDNLEIGSLCGLKSKDWLHVDETDKIGLTNVDWRNITVQNDTITIDQNTFFVNEFNVNDINNFSIATIIEDSSFKLGKNQRIEGNIKFEGLVHVRKLTSNDINNTTASMFITKHTNQNLSSAFIDVLEVSQIFVEKINGVPINEAARKSQPIVVKGMLTVSNLVISGKLIMDENVVLPLVHSMQVYEDVLIDGNIYVKNVKMMDNDFNSETASSSTIIITTENGVRAEYNVHSIMKGSWSRSRNQIFSTPVIIEKRASVDHLTGIDSINAIRLADVVHLNSTEITSSKGPLIFEDVHFVNGVARIINDANNEVESEHFIDETDSVLTIHRTVRLNQLSAISVVTDSYNGIPLKLIMQGAFGKFGSSEFEAVRVSNDMAVDYLRVDRINRSPVRLEKALFVDDRNLRVDSMSRRVTSMNVRSLIVDELLGESLENALQAQRKRLGNLSSLIVNGDLGVRGYLQAEEINGISSSGTVIVDHLKSYLLQHLIESKDIRNLRVVNNLNISTLNGRKVEEFFSKEALMKTSRQSFLPGGFELASVKVNYLEAGVVNGKSMGDELGFVDEPLSIDANVTFAELSVKGRIKSKTVLNEPISKLKRQSQVIPSAEKIKSLFVNGNIYWTPGQLTLKPMHSIEYLLKNAVTKHTNQLLHFPLSFEKSVTINHLHLEDENSFVKRKISKIVDDTVVDIEHSNLLLDGTKTFKNRLSADSVKVTDSFNIDTINGLNVNDAIVQISESRVTGATTFLEQVEIGRLVSNGRIHGIGSDELDNYGQALTEDVSFERLIVQANVALDKLDTIHFDTFKKNRLTTTHAGGIEVYVDVEFTDTVSVLQNQSFASFVNEIKTTDIVVGTGDYNVGARVPTLINDRKIFDSRQLGVFGDVETTSGLDNFPLKLKELSSYVNVNSAVEEDNGVEREIFGDLVFQAGVETLGNVEASQVNGNGNRQQFMNEVVPSEQTSEPQVLRTLGKLEFLVKSLLPTNATSIDLSNTSSNSGTLFHYLEQNNENERLALMKDSRLAEMLARQLKSIESRYGNRSDVYVASCRFHDYTNKSNQCTVDFSSERCSLGGSGNDCESHVQKVFLKELDGTVYELLRFYELNVADARIFTVGDRTYLILAIFYNEKTNSHATASQLYEINLHNRSANFVQFIKTDGAKILQAFEISNSGLYALIGCVKGKAESLLLRFDEKSRTFELIRAFATGGSKYVSSVSVGNETFVILSNPDIEALQIFAYDSSFDNFYDYQNLHFESKTTSLNVIGGGSSHDEVFIVTTTKNGWLYIYEHMLYGKFKLKVSYWIEDSQIAIPIHYGNKNYLFSGTKSNNSVFTVIQQDFIKKSEN